MKFKWLIIAVYLFFSCTKEESIMLEQDILETPDWTKPTHGNIDNPNFSIVFPENFVNRIDIEINSENWEKIQTDLEENSGSSQGPGQSPGSSAFDPVWVPCDVYFNGIQWYKVGIRYKGNSSLNSTYRAGIKKLPLKLDFDQFEDIWPAIQNQRFYGFKQLSLKNNF